MKRDILVHIDHVPRAPRARDSSLLYHDLGDGGSHRLDVVYLEKLQRTTRDPERSIRQPLGCRWYIRPLRSPVSLKPELSDPARSLSAMIALVSKAILSL